MRHPKMECGGAPETNDFFFGLKGRVVCGTVYGDMYLKDLLGSIATVEYSILVPDFYLVLHGP